MHHAILGPGGVGGLIAAGLAKSGDRVTLVMQEERFRSYPEQVQLESPFGNISVAVEKATTVPAADVLWITVKATQLERALTSFQDGKLVRAIVPLLNGIDHVPMLRSRYGNERVFAATIAVEAERIGPGHIVHRSPFARLNVSAAGKPLLDEPLRKLQELGFNCKFVENEASLLWGKLVFLGPIALSTTAADKPIGGIAADTTLQRQLEAAVREACTVAQSEGAQVDAEAVIGMIHGLPGHMRSSMQKDVEQGKEPELDAIAGPILRYGARHGIDVPVTTRLTEDVKRRAASAKV